MHVSGPRRYACARVRTKVCWRGTMWMDNQLVNSWSAGHLAPIGVSIRKGVADCLEQWSKGKGLKVVL